LRQGDYKAEIEGGGSEEVEIEHSGNRLRKLKGEDPKRGEEMKQKGVTRASVIKMRFREGGRGIDNEFERIYGGADTGVVPGTMGDREKIPHVKEQDEI
jgi:hypothetical protein